MFTTLMYHLVDDAISTPMSVPRAKFLAQMQSLGQMDITLLSQSDVNAILDGEKSAPHNGVFLTFDDGYRNTVTDVLPVLDRFGLPATVAVCSSYLLPRFRPRQTVHHSQDFASAAELKSWLDSGRDMAGHTYDHPRLTDLDEAALRFQIGADKRILEDVFERRLDTFLYPFGAMNDFVADIAAEYYPTVFSISEGSLPAPQSRHRITRVFIDPDWSQADFERNIEAELANVTRP